MPQRSEVYLLLGIRAIIVQRSIILISNQLFIQFKCKFMAKGEDRRKEKKKPKKEKIKDITL